jgi:8-oxo-dGTP diphosphatase
LNKSGFADPLREIVAARLVSPDELPGMALTGPVTAYLGGMPPPGCHRSLA